MHQVPVSAGRPLINRTDGEQRMAGLSSRSSPSLVVRASPFFITGTGEVHMTLAARWNSFACLRLWAQKPERVLSCSLVWWFDPLLLLPIYQCVIWRGT